LAHKITIAGIARPEPRMARKDTASTVQNWLPKLSGLSRAEAPDRDCGAARRRPRRWDVPQV